MQSMKSNRFDRCREAADVAHLLIGYLANRGETVDDEDYLAVSRILSGPAADDADWAEKEQNFWQAYASICAAVGPDLEPMNIYYSTIFESQPSENMPFYARHLRWWMHLHTKIITWFTVVVLVVLMAALAYSNILESLGKSTRALKIEYVNFLSDDYDHTRYKRIGLNCEVDDDTNDDHTDNVTDRNKTICANRKLALQDEFYSVRFLLDSFIFTCNIGDKGCNEEVKSRSSETPGYVADPLITRAEEWVNFLGSYIVPLLAGTLGACVSILRIIFQNMRTMNLHIRVFRGAYLRIAIGAIAGISIGWFVNPAGPSDALANLTVSGGNGGPDRVLLPLALAFAAGYAMEIIFTALDRIVGAFTSPPSQQKTAEVVN